MPVFDMTEENFLYHQVWDVFTFGTPPVAIDLMLKVEGLEFDNSYKNAVVFIEDNLSVRTIHTPYRMCVSSHTRFAALRRRGFSELNLIKCTKIECSTSLS